MAIELPFKIKRRKSYERQFLAVNAARHEAKNFNQTITFVFATLFTICIIAILELYEDSLNVEEISRYFNIDTSYFVAETSEKLQFFFGVALFPVFYISFHRIFFQYHFYFFQNRTETVQLLFMIIMGAITLSIVASNPGEVAGLLKAGNESPLIQSLLILGFFIFNSALIMLYEKLKYNRKFMNIASGTTFVLCAFIIAFGYITNDYFRESAVQGRYFSDYFSPVYRAFSGQIQFADFNILFGFYSYLLAPIFKAIGSMTMMNFSIVMGALAFISVCAVAYVIYGICENNNVALIGSLAVAYITSVFSVSGVSQIFYLHFLPHRFIFPALIILVGYLLIKYRYSKRRHLLFVLGYAIGAIALVWEFGTGIIVLATFFLLRIYLVLTYHKIRQKEFWVVLGSNILGLAVSLALSFAFVQATSYSGSGEFISIQTIMFEQSKLYSLGYLMNKTSFVHPWLLLIVLYICSFTKAIRNLRFLRVDREIKSVERRAVHFIVTLIGVGLFYYYIGRSTDSNFIQISWPGMILITLYCDDYIRQIDFSGSRIRMSLGNFVKIAKAVFVILFLSAFAARFVLISGFFSLPLSQNSDIQKSDSEIHKVSKSISMIKGDDEIDIIANYACVIYMLNGDPVPAYLPDTTSMFTKESYKKTIDYISHTDNKLVIDNINYNLLNIYEKEDFSQAMQRFRLVMEFKGYFVYFPIDHQEN